MEGKIIIKIIIELIFIFSSIVGQAQKKTYIPPVMTQKTYVFMSPELQIDSIFMENLNAMLFDKDDRYMNSRISNPNNRWRHFHIRFEKTDSLNYCVVASLWDIPANSKGFFENNGYFYWFGGEVPPNIILETKSKRRFSYKEQQIIGFYDPLFWYLMYNPQTGSIEVKENFFTKNKW
jgi:hypothetical protein